MSQVFRGVRDGTPTGEPLCYRCQSFKQRQGAAESQTQYFCGSMGNPREPMPFLSYDCSAFHAKNTPNVYNMQERAYIITTDGHILPSDEYYELLNRGKLSKKEQRANKDIGFAAQQALGKV